MIPNFMKPAIPALCGSPHRAAGSKSAVVKRRRRYSIVAAPLTGAKHGLTVQ